MDSYAKLQIHFGTEQRFAQLVPKGQQRVEVPSSWCGAKPGHGTNRTIVRTVHVMGTVETSYYGTKRVEYGKCVFNRMVLIVVQNGTNWSAVEKREVQGCTA